MKILGMSYAPRRESRSQRQAKAFRATEQGIAGHQAAMASLGFAAGGWGNSPEKFSFPYAGESADSADGTPDVITPGKGHVSVLEPNIVDRHKPTEDF